MGLEKYQLSESEVKSAERMMSEKEVVQSDLRNKNLETIRSVGKMYGFEVDTENLSFNNAEGHIEGSVQGHRLEFSVKLKKDSGGALSSLTVSIDGIGIDDEKMKTDLFKKFGESVFSYLKTGTWDEHDNALLEKRRRKMEMDAMATAKELLK